MCLDIFTDMRMNMCTNMCENMREMLSGRAHSQGISITQMCMWKCTISIDLCLLYTMKTVCMNNYVHFHPQVHTPVCKMVKKMVKIVTYSYTC